MWIEHAEYNGYDEIKSEMRMKNVHIDFVRVISVDAVCNGQTERKSENDFFSVGPMWMYILVPANEILRDHKHIPRFSHQQRALAATAAKIFFQVDK